MNFYGHLLVSTRYRQDPLFGLGSMLPDLESMAGTRIEGLAQRAGAGAAALAAGVRLHHATDAVFHRAPAFCGLMTQGIQALQAGGLGRGPARAVAHIGVELLLDGELATGEAGGAGVLAYRAALRAGEAILEPQAGREGDPARRQFQHLLGRLTVAPIPAAYRQPGFVAERLDRILAPRPRLALRPADQRVVVSWLTRVQPTVREMRSSLTEHVHTKLAWTRGAGSDSVSPPRTAGAWDADPT